VGREREGKKEGERERERETEGRGRGREGRGRGGERGGGGGGRDGGRKEGSSLLYFHSKRQLRFSSKYIQALCPQNNSMQSLVRILHSPESSAPCA
jgi:hypothetical protein